MKKEEELDNVFKKINQVALLANPVRFKILLALYISEIKGLFSKK